MIRFKKIKDITCVKEGSYVIDGWWVDNAVKKKINFYYDYIEKINKYSRKIVISELYCSINTRILRNKEVFDLDSYMLNSTFLIKTPKRKLTQKEFDDFVNSDKIKKCLMALIV